MALTNPLARHDYPRRRALQGDLDRYYRECLRSPTARGLGTLERRKEYCSGVAWKRVHQSGRYDDYFREYENPVQRGERIALAIAAALGLFAIGRAVLA